MERAIAHYGQALRTDGEMIEDRHGNIFQADADALVNPVNCAGVMGAGLASLFRDMFPANYEAYREACGKKQVIPGSMFVFGGGGPPPRYIINFPTKRHWKDKSRIEDIESGLVSLVENVSRLGIISIAIPAIGCGLGGLNWAIVRPKIVDAFRGTETRVILFGTQ